MNLKILIRNSIPKFTKEQFLRCKTSGLQCNARHIGQTCALYEKNQTAQNVDLDDVKRHGGYSDWWEERGQMLGLHTMNKLRIPLIRNGLENTGKIKHEDIKSSPKYLKGIKILEVGCGGGILTEPLARLGADVTGIDPGLEQINIAEQHAAEYAHTFDSNKPKYLNSTIEDHSLKNPNTYDVVIASEVIEHVPDKMIFLDACVKTLKPTGSIFLTAPNRTTLSWLGIIIIAEDIMKILPKGIHDWDNFVTPDYVQQLLLKLDCSTVSVNGMLFNIFNYGWKWTKSTQFHYALHAVKSSKATTEPVVK